MSHGVELPVLDGGPEAIFRLDGPHVDGGLMRGSVPLGPWTAGADGRTAAGSLGVLVDNVLGYAIFAARPPDHWSVSTEITLDIVPTLGEATGRVHAEGRLLHADLFGGLATGRVLDEDGDLLAVCTQRGRFVPRRGARPARPAFDLELSPTADLTAALGVREVGRGAILEVGTQLQNPMGNLHGGITLCVSELVAAAAASQPGVPPFETTSLHVTYVRPVVGGSAASFTADVRHRGRSLAVVDVTCAVDGRACTFATVVAQRSP